MGSVYARPDADPDWATAGVFANPPIAGQPNKAQPGAGVVSEGFDPADYFRVEHLNWMLNDHGQFIRYLDAAIAGRGVLLADDFESAAISGQWQTFGTAPATFDDSAAGAFGCLRFNPGVGATAQLYRSVIYPMGTLDFTLSGMFRFPNALLAGQYFFFGIFDGAGQELSFSIAQGSLANHIRIRVNANAYVDAGLFGSAVYQNFTIRRLNGNVSFLIDGNLIYTTPYVSAFNAVLDSPRLQVDAGGAGAFDVRCDYVKHWIDR